MKQVSLDLKIYRVSLVLLRAQLQITALRVNHYSEVRAWECTHSVKTHSGLSTILGFGVVFSFFFPFKCDSLTKNFTDTANSYGTRQISSYVNLKYSFQGAHLYFSTTFHFSSSSCYCFTTLYVLHLGLQDATDHTNQI